MYYFIACCEMFAQLRYFDGAKPGKKPQVQLQAGSSGGEKHPNQDSQESAESEFAPAGIKSYKFLFVLKKSILQYSRN